MSWDDGVIGETGGASFRMTAGPCSGGKEGLNRGVINTKKERCQTAI